MGKNIAILTMSLNIGGAETHIYELACALSEKGHNVAVFSAGGVYADKLKENGITHITAPLNKKDFNSLKQSYKLVSDYVKQNKPCVIHSHTRISNLTAFAVSKKLNIPFVSTVHFNFSTGLLQKMLTKWGDRAIAVSEDLKNYAADNYGFDKEKISITVNGINLNTFKHNPSPEFKSSLGIDVNAKVILCVSRLDEVAGKHVHHVLTMAKDIYKNNNDANIVIVGGGTRFKEFTKLANEINAQTKDGFIRLLGPQTDIYKYCNIADLFIGISRSALEAMACKVPTILLGNSGYLGLYSKESEPMCIDTNFTCRNCPYPDDNVIIELIHDMLSNPHKYEDNVNGGYEIVKNRYSVDRMANDALDAYQKALDDIRPYDIMICGYYGRHNLGDDMALKALIDNAENVNKAKRLLLLTANTEYIPHGNIERCIHRFDIPKIIKYLKQTKMFLLGSGSILQDATSSRSIFYYLFVLKQALFANCATMLYSNGIGPINNFKNKKSTVKLLNKVNMITVRDRKSLVYLRSIGVDNENIEITADETFTLKNAETHDKKYLKEDKKYLCINLREIGISNTFCDNFVKFIDTIANKYGYIPVLLPMHYSQDMHILSRISSMLECEHILIDEKLPHEQVLSILSQCEMAIIERLHAVIFSCIYSKPFLAVNYDPKILSFCTEMGMEDYVLDIESFDIDSTLTQFENLYKNKDTIILSLKQKTDDKRILAENNAKYAAQFLR